MGYEHGTHTKYLKSIVNIPTQVETAAVYIGVAPVHLVKGYKDKNVVDFPVKITSMDDAIKNFGYTDNWGTYTLCEAFAAHFENNIQQIGTLAVINVLDPEKHRKGTGTTQEIIFANRIARIATNTIILDTLVLADMVEDIDYSINYDFDSQVVVLTLLNDEDSKTVNVTYDEIDPTQIKGDNIIGIATEDGEYSGIEAVDLVYQELNLMPAILASPGFSEIPVVYKALVKKADKINGHWDAFVNADIPIKDVDSITKAIQWKKTTTNAAYNYENSKAYWPQWKASDGKVYHLSTLATWLMQSIDYDNDGIPMETPSNKRILSGRQFFGEGSKNKGFDQQRGNLLNEKGITTAVYFAGRSILWGPHTAAYEYGKEIDPRAIFDSNIRMIRHISNNFHKDHALDIDKPMPRPMIDSIKNMEEEKLDSLTTKGALIGTASVEFVEKDNPVENMVNGSFTWSLETTVTPPGKSLGLNITYTTDGFYTLYDTASNGGE